MYNGMELKEGTTPQNLGFMSSEDAPLIIEARPISKQRSAPSSSSSSSSSSVDHAAPAGDLTDAKVKSSKVAANQFIEPADADVLSQTQQGQRSRCIKRKRQWYRCCSVHADTQPKDSWAQESCNSICVLHASTTACTFVRKAGAGKKISSSGEINVG